MEGRRDPDCAAESLRLEPRLSEDRWCNMPDTSEKWKGSKISGGSREEGEIMRLLLMYLAIDMICATRRWSRSSWKCARKGKPSHDHCSKVHSHRVLFQLIPYRRRFSLRCMR